MPHFSIDLTSDEKILLSQIVIHAGELPHDHVAVRKNGELVCTLMKSLIARGAIPEQRVHYFNDPDYRIGGRGSSRRQMFEKYRTCGTKIFEHPHFLEYLYYFLYGPALPQTAIDSFCAEVDACGPVTSGDIAVLRKCARQLTRLHGLAPHKAAEEFFKLALDCGLSADYSTHIRDSVRSVR